MSNVKHSVIWNDNELYYQTEIEKYTVRVEEASSTNDFESIVAINLSVFPHDNDSDEYARVWVRNHWTCPYYVIKYETHVVGYILWNVRGGYKSRMSCELEQIAIDAHYHGQGFGSHLLKISLIKFESLLRTRLQNSTLKIGIIHLTTGCSNHKGQEFYKRYLHAIQKGGRIGAIFGSNEYGEEEIVMINENIEPLIESFSNIYRNLKI